MQSDNCVYTIPINVCGKASIILKLDRFSLRMNVYRYSILCMSTFCCLLKDLDEMLCIYGFNVMYLSTL